MVAVGVFVTLFPLPLKVGGNREEEKGEIFQSLELVFFLGWGGEDGGKKGKKKTCSLSTASK